MSRYTESAASRKRMDLLVERWQRFFIEITNRCNFDCTFCPSAISRRPRRDMARDLAFSLIDQLRDLGYDRRIYFHVLGEPLLNRAVFDIVERAAEAGMRPVLFTNGGALTEGVVRDILASRVEELVISMQTINCPSYERLRKTPFDWDTYLGRIQDALAMAESAPQGCVFRVSMGLKKADSEHPEDMYFLEYESHEQVKQGIADLLARVRGIDLTPVFSELDAHGVDGMPAVRISDRLSLSVKPMGNWRRVWRDERATSGRCPFFGAEWAVLADGSLTFCHIDYDGRTSIGNVSAKPLAKILGAPNVRQMVEGFIAGRVVAPGCEHCRGLKPVVG